MFVAPLVVALCLAPAEKVVPLARQQPVPQILLAQPVFNVPLGVPGLPPGAATTTAPAAAGMGGAGDETILRQARLGTSDADLIAFFRQRTPPAPPRTELLELIKQLDSTDVARRDAAQARLVTIGLAALPLLRQTANNVDAVELAGRARDALRQIEGNAGAALVTQAARLLAARKTPGTAEVLIGYLPFAEDEATFQEIELALVAVALRDGKPDPALVQALKDGTAIRRGTAAQVLCQASGSAHPAIRPLLKDANPSVRLRAALGLVGAYDAEAIPVLIDLLAELTPRLRQQAEEHLIGLAGEWAVSGPAGNDLMARRLRRDVWAAWWKNTDGAMLLEEFRSRILPEEERERLGGLIARLGDASGDVRDAAVNDLIAAGKGAAPLLRRAVSENHPQVSPLAARALESIEKDSPSPLPSAAPRLLALRRPEGTVETLVGYLPFCESNEAGEAILDILAAVGCPGGQADPALVKALADRSAVRRAGAVVALCKGRATPHLPAVRKLLDDRDPMVQLRAAQGLAALGDKEAVPVLIGLLRKLPLEVVWDVEDYLGRLAGDKAPTEAVSADPASRGRVADAWGQWWKENEKATDLNRLDLNNRELGLSLVVENWNPALGKGRILEVDGAGKIRWEIKDLQWPNDAQLLRGGNVLIVEQQNRVSERDRSGKVVGLDRHYPSVFHVERLRDGTTFVACRNQLLLVDAKGGSIFTHAYTLNSILAARRFRDGSIAYVSYSGHYVRLDRTGKQVKSFNLTWVNYSPNGAEILTGDRVVVSDSRSNKVVEFNPDGKITWECPIMFPLTPTALASGNLLVAGNSNQAIFEIDRKGKIVKEWKGFTFRPFRVARR